VTQVDIRSEAAVRASTPSGAALTDASAHVPSVAANLFALVERLSSEQSASVTGLARATHISPPTTHRLLRALVALGYVEQLPDSRRYRMTLKVFELGNKIATRTTVRDLALVEMEHLSQETGLAVNLGILSGRDVVYVAQTGSDSVVVLNLTLGSRVPANCTAMGKAILAFQPGSLNSIFGSGPLETRTEYSISTIELLELALVGVRSAGFAADRAEFAQGVLCVAAPILGLQGGVPAALSVTSFHSAWDESDVTRTGYIVKAAAERVAKAGAALPWG